MTPEGKAQLKLDEGKRLKPYRCSAGKLTIGYGRNLDANGISQDEAEFMLDNDIADAENACLHAFPWFSELSDTRKDAIVNMCFNLGLTKLLEFKKFLKAMAMGAYETAAHEAMDSDWAEQVGDRAKRLATAIRGPEQV